MFGSDNNYKLEKEEFLSVINHLTEGLLVFDSKNKLSLINPKAEELLGVEKDKVLGRYFLDLDSYPKCEALVSALGGGIKKVSEKEIKIKDNFVLEVNTIQVRNQKKVGTLIILRDITREKKVERMKTEFVTLAAHQLRTPMSGIKWSLKMILDGELGKLSQKQKEVLEESYYVNNKAIDLVNDLLNVAKIEEGKYISKMTLSNLEDIIEEVVKKHSRKLKEKNLDCRIEKSEEELPKVMLDVEKIKIAFANILENSIFYTLSGGKIIISIKRKEKDIEVKVEDTGVGIPEAEQDKVFEKFFRAKNIMRIETEGTGLGLYITKNIIEAHGGRIWFESEEGKGTTFYFTIPIKKEFGEYLTSEFY